MKYFYGFIILSLLISPKVFGQGSHIKGSVVNDETGEPLVGASVRVLSQTIGTSSDSEGEFSLQVPSFPVRILISFIGFKSKEAEIVSNQETIIIRLIEDGVLLEGVTISSGYQTISRELSTGSFVQIDNKLFNRRASPDVISRLEDIAPGLVFNRAGASKPASQTSISLRGQSSIFGREDPLIVLDNFPYNGDLSSINPNDIESITVLKDASAASIWGAQAGNGVIVITSKKGKKSDVPKVTFSTYQSITGKPDLFYTPVISASEYIDLERMLFERGFYNALQVDRNHPPLTPVVEILLAQRNGLISNEDAEGEIDFLRRKDLRNDLKKYMFRAGQHQQYAVNIQGGTDQTLYRLSYGFDRNKEVAVGDQSERHTISYTGRHQLLNNRLTLRNDLYLSISSNQENSVTVQELYYATGKPLYPYASLADENGVPSAINYGYRQDFVQQAMSKGLLAWTFSPLIEQQNKDNLRRNINYRINTAAEYKLTDHLKIEVLYQYDQSLNNLNNRRLKESWYVRDLVNRFTFSGVSGSLTRPVPYGDILQTASTLTQSQSLRTQVTYNRDLKSESNLNILAGTEARDSKTASQSTLYYGYNDELATSQLVDHFTRYTSFVNPASKNNLIPSGNSLSGRQDRFLSYYLNGVYSYKRKYILTASARLDQSNLFGVRINQKGVPLYSVGTNWKISDERFYKSVILPYISLRTTFGYSGNVYKALSAYTTASYASSSLTGSSLPYASITNPPNPYLRWERVRMINTAIDFGTQDSRLRGSIDFYLKKSMDLIGNAPLAPQTGVLTFSGNTAEIVGRGMEVSLTANNRFGKFNLETSFIYSRASDKVSKYLAQASNVAGAYLIGGTGFPTEGKPFYAVYSYQWAGLDKDSGDPMGYLEGNLSKNYSGIKSSTTLEQLKYHGTLRPLSFGSFRNTLSFMDFSLSANVTYRLGYAVRTNSVLYSTILTGNGGHADFAKRWQNSGDENITHIPSMPSTLNPVRDEFYQYAEVLVERGDHIRLQDINFSYKPTGNRSFIKNGLTIFLYANNLGILWKKTDKDIDPDFVSGIPAAKSIALGLNITY